MLFLNYMHLEVNDKIIHFPDCLALKCDLLKSLKLSPAAVPLTLQVSWKGLYD